MTETIENLAQNLRADEALIKTHLNNPFAHPIADPFNMSKEGYAISYGFVSRQQIGQALGIPWYLPDNTDIFSLDPGYYKCYKPKGLPDNISIRGSVWTIKVNYPLDSRDAGLITATDEFGSQLVAVRHSGNWNWLRYGDKVKFGGDLANSASYYTLIHTENKIQVHCHIDIETNVTKNSYKSLSNPYPGSLWLPEWSGGRMEDGLSTTGVGKGSGFKSVQMWFNPLLYIINYNDIDINHVWGDFRYELDKF
ncbi:hypothetical protein A8C46_08495 [Ligilactobacillus salivarius]|uniref:hypothetical protein n=1 Tax=Ligilactobacillus salivarius TaxID=1624 RepID=UPI000A2DB7FF|nr:hypothetical protein [Ligilactobacillus salivarius]OTF89028.1 hypothetical protein A8C38_01500 [Ligilactobacillus salivarius]PAY42539.1 hypothetical protein A8C39_08395 [Ligilactobacillus salivarius]PAY48768.1 hypothetical protein A8C42_07850 [Ligilactobacillus salivarius]PAY52650.1 hypothetical protein A8C41_08925 [Ligilactobacillus salivarius]PAY56612.1 hypothetical protein A8C46_08495 [Ligilactobacillus salivarius]